MKSDESSTASPNVWVLQTARAGDSAQARALADELGWPFELVNLRFNGLYNIPNSWLGATLGSVTAAEKAQLTPPWPDLVIAVARRTVPVARWIKQQSGGTTRLVHLGRPRLGAKHFDLVISTPQYSVPDAPNVLQLPVPLHGATQSSNSTELQQRFSHLPRPWTAVLIGGEAWPYRLAGDAAISLASQTAALTQGNGSVIICTSPRTPEAFAQTLCERFEQPAEIAAWQRGSANPYPALLETADRFIVTGDSASMLAEACAREKPVYIYDMPRRALSGLVTGVGGALAQAGILHPPRDMSKIHQALITGNHAAPLGTHEWHQYKHVPLVGSLAAAADRVRGLFP